MGEHTTGSPDEDLRIGPYDVFRTLVDAPGGKIIEARDSGGEQRLLQLARCRPPANKTEQSELDDYVRMIAQATSHFDADPDVRVIAHGNVTRGDGSRILYWALPWKESAERLGRAHELILAPDELIDVALSLLARVSDRHERGRLDPLLAEQLVIVRETGGAIVAGVPIHLPLEWLASDVMRPRFAPEEMLRYEPTRTGDMWRLGQALRGLGAHLEPLPSSVRRIIDALSDPDPELRLNDPGRALKELEAQRGTRAAKALKLPDRTGGPSARGIPTAHDTLEQEALRDTLPPDTAIRDVFPREVPMEFRSTMPWDSQRIREDLRAELSGESSDDIRETLPRDAIRAPNVDPIRDTLPRDPKRSMYLGEGAHDTLIMPALPRPHDPSSPTDPSGPNAGSEPSGPSGPTSPEEGAVDTGDLGADRTMRMTFEDRTDRMPENLAEKAENRSMPLANMRAAAPLAPDGPTLNQIVESPTLMELKPPQSLRASAASLLEAHRRRALEGGQGPHPVPSILLSDTIVDEVPAGQDDELEVMTLHDQDRQLARNESLKLNILDPVELGGSGESAGNSNSAWERANNRARMRAHADPRPLGANDRDPQLRDPRGGRRVPEPDEAENAMHPMGPRGTLVGTRELGPKGTLVGIKPVRAKELIAQGRSNAGAGSGADGGAGGEYSGDPAGSGPGPGGAEPRGSTVIGVPSLEFRGRDQRPSDADAFPIDAPRARMIAGTVTGEFDAPQALRPVRFETSDDIPVVREGAEHQPGPVLLDNPALDQMATLPAGARAPLMLPSGQYPSDPANRPAVRPDSKGLDRPLDPEKKKNWLKRLMYAAVAMVFIAGAALYAGRQFVPGKRGARPVRPIEVSSLNEVDLIASPIDAIVVGEGDGRILGPTPLTFLVAPGKETPVLITAKDHEPQRLVLPDRGAVNVALRKLPSARSCEVTLTEVGERRLESVGEDVLWSNAAATADAPASSKTCRVPGATVIRALDGSGAWIVQCPELGGSPLQPLNGRPPLTEERIHVTEPENVLFFVDGQLGGAVPFGATVQRGFALVRVETLDGSATERWIPAFHGVILAMPRPPAKVSEDSPY